MDSVEKEILSGIRKSDAKAFEELFKRYYSSLLHYAITLLMDQDLAKDAIQQVFIHIWEKRLTLDKIKNLKAYLFRSVYNTSINLLKQKQLNDKARQVLSMLQPDTEQSFLLNIEAGELENRIMNEVSSLPEKCRQVFELSRFEGLKNKEVANRMGISLKTVEAQLTKALRILRLGLSR